MKTHKIYLTTAAIALMFGMSVCSNAQSADSDTAASASEMRVANAPSWTIQAEGSHLKFSALQEGETFTGEFTEFSGDIHFDPDNLAGSHVKIMIPIASISAGSKDRDNTVPGKVWFNAKAFPSAVFETEIITETDDTYTAVGSLTLKGKSQPLSLPFILDVTGDTALMKSQIAIDRTKWDVGAAPWNTDEWVSRSVDLDIQVTATRD